MRELRTAAADPIVSVHRHAGWFEADLLIARAVTAGARDHAAAERALSAHRYVEMDGRYRLGTRFPYLTVEGPGYRAPWVPEWVAALHETELFRHMNETRAAVYRTLYAIGGPASVLHAMAYHEIQEAV